MKAPLTEWEWSGHDNIEHSNLQLAHYGPLFFCVQGKFPPRPSLAPLMLIPGLRPPRLLNVAYNKGLIRASTWQPDI